MVWSLIFESLLTHSEALAVVGLGLYIAYETRIGAIREVRSNQRTLGVALYRVIERDDELDEEAFRHALWDKDSDQVLLSDLDRDPLKDKGD